MEAPVADIEDGILQLDRLPDLPIIQGNDLWSRIEWLITGYFRYYKKQVPAWKHYLEMRRAGTNEYGEAKGQAKSEISAHAEMRVSFAFPSFWDPLTDAQEPLLPILQAEFKKQGYEFPQTRTPEGKKLVLEFHRRFKDLFGVAEKM